MTATKRATRATPSRHVLLRPSTLLLAAAIVLELSGARALQTHTRWATVAGADGDTLYVSAAGGEVRIVAEADTTAR